MFVLLRRLATLVLPPRAHLYPYGGAGAARAVFQPTSCWTPARSLYGPFIFVRVVTYRSKLPQPNGQSAGGLFDAKNSVSRSEAM